MRLSDVMSAAGLSTYAEVGLVLFLAAFVGVVLGLYASGRKDEWAELSRLPLDEEARDD